MTKQEIIWELFSESPAMAAHLSENGNCGNLDLLNAVCGAPVALRRKLELLRECLMWDLDVLNGKHDQNEECKKRIDVIEQALSQLEAKPGDVFLWRNCWYDRDWRDSDIGRSSFQPCLSMAEVYAAIDGFIAEEAEGLTEVNIAMGFSGDVGWYEIQKWEQQTGDAGQVHLVKTPWEYIYADHKLCYFSRQFTPAERHDWAKKQLWEICDGSSNLNLSIPFRRGDIITVNCEPFAPLHHAVLLHIGPDCCGVQIAYVDENNELQTAALKHSHCFTDNYLSKLSPLYRLSLYDGELGEEEQALKWIHEDIRKCSEEGQEVYCRGLWDAIQIIKIAAQNE